jgi:hypothetical protein
MSVSNPSKPKSRILVVKLVNAVRTGLRAGVMVSTSVFQGQQTDQLQQSQIQTQMATSGSGYTSSGPTLNRPLP